MFLTCSVINFLKCIRSNKNQEKLKTFQLVGHLQGLVDHRSCSEAICAIRQEYQMHQSRNVVQSSFQHRQHNGCDQLDIRY